MPEAQSETRPREGRPRGPREGGPREAGGRGDDRRQDRDRGRFEGLRKSTWRSSSQTVSTWITRPTE